METTIWVKTVGENDGARTDMFVSIVSSRKVIYAMYVPILNCL